MAVGLIGLVAWGVRVEALTKQNSSDIRGLWRQRNEDLESHRVARSETNLILTELRADVKTLLRGAGK
jgi:hypothetical protein